MNTQFLNILNVDSLIKLRENTLDSRGGIDISRMLTTDINVINYRTEALDDLLRNKDFYNAIVEIIPEIIAYQELRSAKELNDNLENLYAVKELQSYTKLVDYLHGLFENYPPKSELFGNFMREVNQIYSSDEYNKVKKSAPENLNMLNNMRSVTVGVNIGLDLRPIESGIVSINSEKYVSGNILDKIMRADITSNQYQCAAPLGNPNRLLTAAERQQFEFDINNSIYKILGHSLKSWRPAVKAYTASKMSDMVKYLIDLRFLTAAAGLFFKLKSMNYPVCRPVIHAANEKKCTLKGAYFPEFVLQGTHMKGNDIEFDEEGMIYIFSGANGGGKTLFMKSAAICQVLFQLGLFVPAEYAELSPCSEIIMCLPNYDVNNTTQSRFMTECEKMSNMMKLADENTMIMCDEAFSGTNSAEAAAIAAEVIKAMSAKGSRGIFITHSHELTSLPDEINHSDICKSRLDNLTVEVEKDSGKRTYKVIRTRSEGSSRASDIAKRYGLDFESLMEK